MFLAGTWQRPGKGKVAVLCMGNADFAIALDTISVKCRDFAGHCAITFGAARNLKIRGRKKYPSCGAVDHHMFLPVRLPDSFALKFLRRTWLCTLPGARMQLCFESRHFGVFWSHGVPGRSKGCLFLFNLLSLLTTASKSLMHARSWNLTWKPFTWYVWMV